MDLMPLDSIWETPVLVDIFNCLEAYRKENGHCRVPLNYEQNPQLGKWVKFRRDDETRGRILEPHKARLDAIGFEWKAKPKKVEPESSINVEDDEEPEFEMAVGSKEQTYNHLEALEDVQKLNLSRTQQLGVPIEATVHLDRFKNALIKAQSTKKKKNTSIHRFFQPAKKQKTT